MREVRGHTEAVTPAHLSLPLHLIPLHRRLPSTDDTVNHITHHNVTQSSKLVNRCKHAVVRPYTAFCSLQYTVSL